MSFNPDSAEAMALQRKPIGSAALEVLIALRYQSAVVFVTVNPRDNGECDFYHHDSFVVLDPQTFREAPEALSSQTGQRLMDAMISLEKRGWIEKIGMASWINLADGDRTTKLDTDARRRREQWSQKSRGSYSAQRLSYQITPRGEQALASMPARVEKFWREKNSTPRYLISAQGNVAEPTEFLATGIYKIERETEDRVFVSKKKVEGAVDFEQEGAMQAASTYSRVYGFYVNRVHILMMDAEPKDFNQLYALTKQAREESRRIEEKSNKKISEILSAAASMKHDVVASTVNQTREMVVKLEAQRLRKETEQDEDFVMDEEELGGLNL